MTDDEKMLLERAVVALERIADALHGEHDVTVVEHLGNIHDKLENDEGGSRLADIASAIRFSCDDD